MKHLIWIIPLLILACKSDNSSVEDKPADIVEASIDDELALSLGQLFRDSLFKDQMQFIDQDTGAFQFYKIDLNQDGKDEIFVRFTSSYFCNASGCEFLILDKELRILNKFTAMIAPIFATDNYEENWRILLNEADGQLRMLINKNGRYPSNPMMTPESKQLKSETDIIMFDDLKAPSKQYFF